MLSSHQRKFENPAPPYSLFPSPAALNCKHVIAHTHIRQCNPNTVPPCICTPAVVYRGQPPALGLIHPPKSDWQSTALSKVRHQFYCGDAVPLPEQTPLQCEMPLPRTLARSRHIAASCWAVCSAARRRAASFSALSARLCTHTMSSGSRSDSISVALVRCISGGQRGCVRRHAMLSSRISPQSSGCRRISRALGRQTGSECKSILSSSLKSGERWFGMSILPSRSPW